MLRISINAKNHPDWDKVTDSRYGVDKDQWIEEKTSALVTDINIVNEALGELDDDSLRIIGNLADRSMFVPGHIEQEYLVRIGKLITNQVLSYAEDISKREYEED